MLCRTQEEQKDVMVVRLRCSNLRGEHTNDRIGVATARFNWKSGGQCAALLCDSCL